MTMTPLSLYVMMVLGFAKLRLQEMIPQELHLHLSLDVPTIGSVTTRTEALVSVVL